MQSGELSRGMNRCSNRWPSSNTRLNKQPGARSRQATPALAAHCERWLLRGAAGLWRPMAIGPMGPS